MAVATYFVYTGLTPEQARKEYENVAAKMRIRYAPRLPLLETDWSVLEQYQKWLANEVQK